MKTFRLVGAAVAFAVGMLIGMGGCAAPGAPLGPVPVPDGTLDLGSPGAQVATYQDVKFYPACGNETLDYQGKTWFPFRPANLEDFPGADGATNADASAAAATGIGGASSPGTASASVRALSLPAVVAPGPGDDVGTLTVYEKGFAYWVSDSGDLDTWLTNHELTYNWAC